MATEAKEYPGMLSQLEPQQAVTILNDRVAYVGRVNTAIADWLQERRRLEEQYAASLRRLAQRPLDTLDLGVFAGPWSTLMSSADTLANSHSTFANKIQADVERPLRDFASSNGEMRAMPNTRGNLQAIATEVERAQQKQDKARSKGERSDSTRSATANSDLEGAQSAWQAQAPFIFESLQSLDEARVTNLRDALTQFQTHEMDQVERDRVSGEQCLIVLLGVEPGDEIKSFAAKALQNKPPIITRPQRNSISVASPSRGVTPIATNTLTQPPSRSEEDLSRQRTGSTDDKAKGRVKGLKRFGTVLGRKNRESKIPSDAPSPSESPAPRSRPSPFRFGRSRDAAPTLETTEERSSPLGRPSLPPQLGSEIFDSPAEARADPTTPRPILSTTESAPQINGTTALAASIIPAAATIPAFESQQNETRGIEMSSEGVPQRKESLAALEGRTDSEGFSIPPQNLDPISQAQQDAALYEDGGTTPQFNVNIRDAPIQQDTATSETDLASAATKLQAPPPSTKRTSTVRGRRQDRNSVAANSAFAPPEPPITEAVPLPTPFATRDLSQPAPLDTSAPVVESPTGIAGTGLVQSPSTTFAPGQLAASTFSPFTPQAEQPPQLQPDARATPSIDQPRGDTLSIRSATTTGSQSGGIKHPDFTESGLNSSIVETINARFENGRLASSSLIGEIALAYNPADMTSPFGTETIRIENFAALEKVAPNPAFIKPVPDRDAEYTVNLSSIARTQIAFKYQVRLEDGSAGSQAPLLITPAFKIEDNQCSVILSYSLNPGFVLPAGQETLALSNVMLALTLEGTKATGCQSRPVGHFSKEKSMIYWQLNDITVTPSAAPEKLLARFATESKASGGSVEARWEIGGESARGVGSALELSMQGSSGSGGADGSDPFADDDGVQSAAWTPVKGVKKLVSGSYLVK